MLFRREKKKKHFFLSKRTALKANNFMKNIKSQEFVKCEAVSRFKFIDFVYIICAAKKKKKKFNWIFADFFYRCCK